MRLTAGPALGERETNARLQGQGGDFHGTRQKARVTLCASSVLLRREPWLPTCQRDLGRDSIK